MARKKEERRTADSIVHDNVGKMLERARGSKKATEVMLKKIGDLTIALEESVYLQSFYALQLNMLDGGGRVGFKDADAWMARLRETGKLK